MISRRTLIGSASAGLAATLVARATRPAWASRKRLPARRPRYVVNFLLPGGMDSVYTLDPKRPGELEPGLDLPFAPGDITEGAIPLGPQFKPLARWVDRMSVLQAVAVDTANHQTGHTQAIRLKTRPDRRMPGIFDIIGAHRDTQVLPSIYLNSIYSQDYSPTGFFGDPSTDFGHRSGLLETLDSTEPEDLMHLARGVRKNAASLGRSQEDLRTAESMNAVATLFERLAHAPRLALQPWPVPVREPVGMANLAQRTLWLLEHDLTACAFVSMEGDWDTHQNNARQQIAMNRELAAVLDRFLGELHRRSNQFGRLADNTLLIVNSELGRFPRLNDLAGKDHFPVAPFMMFGPSMNAGKVFGATNRRMEAIPLSPRTGRPVGAGGHTLRLDDIGTTVLHIAGLDPERYGYDGRVLDFLVSGSS
jgi:hypothetical protein